MNSKISIIAPIFNEQDVIDEYIKSTISILESHCPNYELLLIDDGSTDNSVAICTEYAKTNKNIKLIVFSRNYGHEVALTAGIDHCQGDYAILMDSDMQHPPELIPQLVEKALEGYDVVSAKRNDRKHESWLKRKTSNLFYSFASKMTGFKLDNRVGNYKIISRNVIASLRQMKENSRHLLMLFAYVGYKSTSIPFDCQERGGGKSKYNYRKLINLAIDSIISFSHRPLRYMSILSILISLILTCYAGFILLQKLFYHQHLAEGVASVIFITSGLFAVLFIFMAIISEYISRILVETKGRPLYYIRNVIQYDESP